MFWQHVQFHKESVSILISTIFRSYLKLDSSCHNLTSLRCLQDVKELTSFTYFKNFIKTWYGKNNKHVGGLIQGLVLYSKVCSINNFFLPRNGPRKVQLIKKYFTKTSDLTNKIRLN